MPVFPTVSLSLVTAVVSLGYVGFGVYVVWNHDGIGVQHLGFFAVVWGGNFVINSAVIALVTTYGVSTAANLQSLSVPPPVELFLVATTPLSGLLSVTAIFGWLWFVLAYTTRLDRPDRIGLLALVGVVFLVTAVNGLVGALSSFGYVRIAPGVESELHRFAGVVEVLGTGVAVGTGIAQLYRASRRHAPFGRDTALGLTLPVLLPYLTRYVYQFGLLVQFRAVELLQLVALSAGLGGLWLAVTRYGVFEQLPASQAVGRETAFETTDTPVVIFGADGRVVDLNPAAGALFDRSPPDTIGSPMTALLPDTVESGAIAEPGRTTFRFPNSDRVVEGETTVTTDDGGREIGRTVVWNDITEERRRQQRIQVLNRVLRHNLRNDLNAAAGYVELMASGDAAPEECAPKVLSKLEGLTDIGAKARKIEATLAADPSVDAPVSLQSVVGGALESVRAEHGDLSVTTEIPDGVAVRIAPRTLRSVVEELVENAAVHAQSADVRVAFDDGALVVEDDGPGIPAYETEVFDREEETPLKHGSGLGLWLVKWGVDRFGGEVRFETEDTGTRAVVAFPADRVAVSDP